MNIKVFCISIIFIIHITSGYGQSCLGFYKSAGCAVKRSADFKQYGQVKSAAVEVGKVYKCSVILYGKKDYIISVCSQFRSKSIHCKIFDKTNNELIYDNEEDSYNNAIAFSVEKTSNIEIEVEIVHEKDKELDPDEYRVCVGIQILWRKIPDFGFN